MTLRLFSGLLLAGLLLSSACRSVPAEDDCKDGTKSVERIAGKLYCIGEPQ